MASHNHSLRVNDELWTAIEERSKQAGYGTVTDYLKSLFRYDLMVMRPHSITLTVSKASAKDQARFDRHLLKRFRQKEPTKGSLLDHIVERVTAQGKTLKHRPTVMKVIMQTMEEPPTSSTSSDEPSVAPAPNGFRPPT